MGFVLGVLAVTFAVMVWEKISLDLCALLAMCALLVAGILTPQEAFQVFSNDAPLTVACMFVLSAALERTGAIAQIGRWLQRFGGQSDLAVLAVALPVVVCISAFVLNTPVVVVFLPILISLAARRNIKPSKLLIPLSYASIFGGCCTLIGTSTNLIVSATAQRMGQPPLAMFELTKIGVVLAAVGLVYLLTVGRKLLPERETLASILETTGSREYLTEVVVAPHSRLIGRRLAETPLRALPHTRVLEVARGGNALSPPLDDVVLQAGDRLRLSTVLSAVMELKGLKGVEMLPHAELGLAPVDSQRAMVVESVIGPNSELAGKTIEEVNFGRRYGVLILAVHREGRNLREDFSRLTLRFGDTILIEGPESAIQKLQADRNFLLLTDVWRPANRWKAAAALGVLAAVVALSAGRVLPLSVAGLIGAVAVVLAGCLKVEEAYRAIHWKIMFMLFGMLSLGVALEKTGAALFLATGLIHGVGWLGPGAVLSAVYLLTSVLTEFLSNTAVAVLLTPIVVDAALALGVDARPFIIAVALGASASFATPVGYQTNTLVYGPGGYHFRDFVKVGLPLNALFWILSSWLIPRFWPFHP
jgi:di/tricarboxylate transporter